MGRRRTSCEHSVARRHKTAYNEGIHSNTAGASCATSRPVGQPVGRRHEWSLGQPQFLEGNIALFVGDNSIRLRRACRSACRGGRGVGGWLQLTLAAAVCFGLFARSAAAGGGPENVLLVVNANSDSSKTIANHYIRLRKIPPTNVVYIDWQGDVEWTSIAAFRTKLLTPLLKAIEDRGLSHQIDYIVYSSDFPWRVSLHALFPDKKPPRGVRAFASLTGVTYLWQYAQTKTSLITSLNTNWYVPPGEADNRGACQKLGQVKSRGFRARIAWAPDATPAKDIKLGQRYFLSTMLGVTSGRGNTVPEITSYLNRAAFADGTRPRGTIYFVKNGDIRSKTRHACYDEVAAQLMRLGVPARVMNGKIPQGANDILGIMAGTARFDLATAGDTILPGAICEHLTSLGGTLKIDSAQTSLTEFLKYGAAGASGTVSEPGAIQAKFPLPSLHVHYVQGCSLAESFYQSITAPYQLLIVGDPLCQPWASFPTVSVAGVEPGQEIHGMLSITPEAADASGRKVAMFETYMDGRIVARSEPGKSLSLDTAQLLDGYHELRVVGVTGDAIETQGRAIVPFRVNNHDRSVELSLVAGDNASSSIAVRLSVRQPEASQINVMQNSRKVGQVDGPEGEVEIASELLGRGVVALQAISTGESAAVSAPVWVHVQ